MRKRKSRKDIILDILRGIFDIPIRFFSVQGRGIYRGIRAYLMQNYKGLQNLKEDLQYLDGKTLMSLIIWISFLLMVYLGGA